MTSMKIVKFSRPPPSFYLRPNFFHFLELERPILNETPHPLQWTMEQQPRRACERTKSKQKQKQVRLHSNWKRVLLFDLAHKQCSSIIKGWLHCLTSESIGRFLTNNNILMFDSAWCLFIAQIQLSLIKKIKIGCPKYSLPLPPHAR